MIVDSRLRKTHTVMLGSTSGTSYQVPGIDVATRAILTIGYEHHEIHAGSSYTAHFDNTTALSDDDVTAIGFTTPNSPKWLHIVAQATASSPAEFFILEAPTYLVSKGNHITIFNRDRNSSKTSKAISLGDDAPLAATVGLATTYIEAEWNAATIASGTVIDHILLAGGEGPKAAGGSSRGSQEWILKSNTAYFFYLQNIGANTNLHEIHLDWYEHTNKAV